MRTREFLKRELNDAYDGEHGKVGINLVFMDNVRHLGAWCNLLGCMFDQVVDHISRVHISLAISDKSGKSSCGILLRQQD
jgi:hypothetical protein